ncbi:MAG: hypothetical protein IGS03_04255 [Candidatus Sericytochromatia bacterium]|nr:hypothetical protein [Candidatus Sericytochromatia bacterium]
MDDLLRNPFEAGNTPDDDTQLGPAQSLEAVPVPAGLPSAAEAGFVRYRLLDEALSDQELAAQDVLLRRYVTYRSLPSDPAARDQALQEARLTARLQHPGVVPVYSLETPENPEQAGYAIKSLSGQTLAQWLKTAQPPADPESVQFWFAVMLTACDTLHYAHTQGISHGNLSPERILSAPFNEVYVLDWGLPPALSAAFAAPEGNPSALADQYALGQILRQLLGGLYLPAKVPPALQAIAARASAPRSADRYSDVAALAQDLRAWLNDQATVAYPDNAWRRLQRWSRHHSARALGLASVLVLTGALALGGSLLLSQRAQQATRQDRLLRAEIRQLTARQGQVLDAYFSQLLALTEGLATASAESWLRRPQQQSVRQSLQPRLQALFQAAPPGLSRVQLHLPQTRLLYAATGWQPDIPAALTAGLPAPDPYHGSWGLPLSLPAGPALLPLTLPVADDAGQTLGQVALWIERPALQALLQPSTDLAPHAVWLLHRGGEAVQLQGSTAQPVPELPEAPASGVFVQQGQYYAQQQLASRDWRLVLAFDPIKGSRP